jgi:hypothetical protein
MSVHEILNEPHLMAAQIDLQRRFNFHVTLGDDFRQYSAIIAKGRAQQPVGLPFDPGHSPIDAGQGFWLVGHTPDGVLAHTQAMRVIDNGSS